jgi:hypothetical protein
MFAFLLFAIFCVIVWALWRNGNWGIAIFLVIAFLVWGLWLRYGGRADRLA